MQDERIYSTDSLYQFDKELFASGDKVVKTFRVEVKETTSKEYEVMGVKTMKEAIALVREEGTHYWNDDNTIQICEVDGSWDLHKTYAPTAVRVLTSAKCTFHGRTFEKPMTMDGRRIGDTMMRDTCFHVIERPGVCQSCMRKIEDGWTLMKEESE